MEILRADKMGFCFGVKVAIDSCYKYKKELELGHNIYILGMLVHNEFVVSQLEKLGYKTISEEDVLSDKIKFLETDVVIIRAHGTTKAVYEKLIKDKVKIEDAACVFVKDIRKKLLEMEAKGYEIIFIGDEFHPEVQGIISFGTKVHIFKDLEDLKKVSFDKNKKYALLQQTTFNKKKMIEIKKYLEGNYSNIIIFNKICGATEERQEAVEKLAKKCDIILIVGGKNSSNTKKLFEIAKELNPNTKLLTNENDIDVSWFKGINTVGITAGASTPEELIIKIENKIKEEHP